ncbi:GLPGLI family protein [Pedobacter insulae]|uniref:GLPGLI family protein n=1 Tax=Pedobacter insulae TaxID=414048 RepID=A0A1I2UVF2_9SPHI|nr:GLPGLI family protein [Pedobacter insulae]SFG78896.1 GLPGLI family protein [Pedobacter insulae]
MKTILITSAAIFISVNTYSQKGDPVLARVRYTYTNKSDTLTNEKPRIENMLLFFGKNTSLYTSYDKIRHEISEEQKFWAMIESGAGKGNGVFVVDDSNSKWMTTTSYSFFVKENKLFTKEMFFYRSYLVEETPPIIDWKLSKDTLSFSGLTCQKATANFEGKNWTVWYAQSVPFPGGPWKLNGLPGLIIEAYDTNKDIYFKFAGMENAKIGDHVRDRDVTKQPGASPSTYNSIDQAIGRDVGNAYFENIIRLPIGAVKISKSQMEKFKEAFKKDPKGFNKALSGN